MYEIKEKDLTSASDPIDNRGARSSAKTDRPSGRNLGNANTVDILSFLPSLMCPKSDNVQTFKATHARRKTHRQQKSHQTYHNHQLQQVFLLVESLYIALRMFYTNILTCLEAHISESRHQLVCIVAIVT